MKENQNDQQEQKNPAGQQQNQGGQQKQANLNRDKNPSSDEMNNEGDERDNFPEEEDEIILPVKERKTKIPYADDSTEINQSDLSSNQEINSDNNQFRF